MKPVSLSEWQNVLSEIQYQPSWRREADKCADYYDGNQLDADTLQALNELGMAPIIENLTAPSIDSVLGHEAQNRADWLVTPEADDKYQDLAEALNVRLNEAERESHADRACSDAYAAQVKTGLSWVLVGREHDPFRYPHKVEAVHRNEMFWDWSSREVDLSDARWVLRRKWYDVEPLKLAFPDKAEVIQSVGSGWQTIDPQLLMEGGQSTDLGRSYTEERAWTIQEHEWRDLYRKRLSLGELWYRRWVRGLILRAPDGRVIEYDKNNPQHAAIVQAGIIEPQEAVFTKLRLSWWIGPHKLADIPNPYKHGKLPYVPFWGKREDMTGVPYGLIRSMIPLQDEVNARNTKMIWLLTAKRVTMTNGVADVEETRNEAARPDAVHVLDPNAMRDGGVFKVDSDFALNSQQYTALADKRQALKNVAGIYSSYEGKSSNVTSGVGLQTLVEQSTQTLSELSDNYRFARAAVGDLLLSNLIADMSGRRIEVALKQSAGQQPKMVVLNEPLPDGGFNNDVERVRLKVALSNVPSTASYRRQQLMMWTEMTKSAPPQLQPFLLEITFQLDDFPEKDKAIESLRKLTGEDPEKQQMQQHIQALTQALREAQTGPQLKELAAKIENMNAKTEDLLASAMERRANVLKDAADAEAQLEATALPPQQQQLIEQYVQAPPGSLE